MRILISILLYLMFITLPATAQDMDDVPQTTRECRSNLSSLGRLIRKHNPNEDHMTRLRKDARIVSNLCRDEKFSRAHRIFLKIKRSIKSVNNSDTDIVPRTERSSKIKQCLTKLRNVGQKVTAASLEDRDRRQIGKFGKRMHKNCRLQRYRRADRDHNAILRMLKNITERRDIRTGGIKNARSCRYKVRTFLRRLNRPKVSRQVKTWIRKSTKEIITLCRRKKFEQADQKYQAALSDFSQYLREEDKPVVAVATSPRDAKNCRRSYTFIFKMINKKQMSSRKRRALLRKRKTLGQYCYEKDFSSAKQVFKELRREISNLPTIRSAENQNRLNYGADDIDESKITADNCRQKIETLKTKALKMSLSPRNLSGLASGRKRIQKLCQRRNYRGANVWFGRVQKRMVQLGKDHNRYNSRVSAHNYQNERSNRYQSHPSNSNEDSPAQEECRQKHKILMRRVADAHSFRLRTMLRLKVALMGRHCRKGNFDKALSIYNKAIKDLDRQ